MPKLDSFKGKGKAGIPQIGLYLQAGIDPKTGLPTRLVDNDNIFGNSLQLLRILDEQDFVNRFEWENIPAQISTRELERLLYYKGSILLFKFYDQYYFMPYALDGEIDFYGRFLRVHPVPMTSGKEEPKDKKENPLEALLSDIKVYPIYTTDQFEELSEEEKKNKDFGVILRDYTNQLSWVNTPRYILCDAMLKLEAQALAYLSLSMLTSSGVKAMRVPDTNAKNESVAAAQQLKDCALSGIPWVSIVSPIEFQSLTDGPTAKIQEYFLALQSLDNFRLSSLGLENGGVFEKGSHILESENNVNQQKNSLVMQDGLSIRQDFCEIANKVFGIDMRVKKIDANAINVGGDPNALDQIKSSVKINNNQEEDYNAL